MSRLFSPIKVGCLEVEQRTWVPAMVPWRATEDGEVTTEVLEWYERFASGQPGVLVVEATGIRDVPSGPLLRIGHDRFVAGLRELAATVRSASRGKTRLLIQIIDFLAIRRRPIAALFFSRYLEITDRHRSVLGAELDDASIRIRLAELSPEVLETVLSGRELEALRFGDRERVTDVEKGHIRDLPRVLPGLFAAAAVRAREAGFDGVELHFAHAYTMASFLSALNTRNDGYGGSVADRVKLPLEVVAEVRGRLGAEFCIGARFLTEECIEGGSSIDDACDFALRFCEAGLDFLSVSRGGKFEDAKQPRIGRASYPYTGPSGYECMPTAISDSRGPFGRNVAAAARVREAIREAGYDTPTVVSGGICTFDQAETILESGQADIVAAARQSLADPDWFLKTKLGRGGEIRRCIYSNYCEGLDQMHKQVTCQLWDREALDASVVRRSHDGKRRLTPPLWHGPETKTGGCS